MHPIAMHEEKELRTGFLSYQADYDQDVSHRHSQSLRYFSRLVRFPTRLHRHEN